MWVDKTQNSSVCAAKASLHEFHCDMLVARQQPVNQKNASQLRYSVQEYENMTKKTLKIHRAN